MDLDAQRGDRILEERKQQKWSQQAAADAAGIRREMWARYEAGAEPGAKALAGMAAAGVDVLYILTGQRSSTSTPASDTESRVVTKRQAALLDHHAGTDEQGKKIIEATAFAAAHPETRKKA